jgi:hypothetical protein
MKMELSLLEQARREVPGVSDAQHVANIAASVIESLGVTPPIDAKMVASFMGVAEIRLASSPWAGCIYEDEGRLVIQVRDTDPPRRQRFSAFHEVGHTFLPGFRLAPQYRCDPDAPKGSYEESLSDIAGAELLLPESFFRGDVEQASFGLAAVGDLADRYDASFLATARRFVDLWAEDALLLVLEVMNKPADRKVSGAPPKLRVAYGHASGDWPFIPRYKSARDGSALDSVLLSGDVAAESDLDGLAPNADVLKLSAQLRPFVDADGVAHERVIALYRRPVPTANARR